MDAAEKSARRGELPFLRRLEPAVRRAVVFYHGDGFLARPPDGQTERSTCQEALARRERLHESEHAWFFQIRKFSSPEFPMAARARRNHLPTTASRHSSSGRDFLLHVSFLVLHARHLSRRVAANAVTPRFHSCSFFFPAACPRSDCACRRLFTATSSSTASEDEPISLGTRADDFGIVRKNCPRRYIALRFGRSRLRLSRTIGGARFLGRRPRVCRPNLFRFRRLFDLRHRRCVNARLSFERQFPFSICRDWFLGFLAALAHFAFHFSARLSLHSARRQSGSALSRRAQSGHCHVSRRSLARRGMDFRRVG